MTTLLGIVLVMLALWFVWRVFKVAARWQLSEEPPAEVEPGDVDVREPAPRRPSSQSGAAAVEEPEAESRTDAYAPRH